MRIFFLQGCVEARLAIVSPPVGALPLDLSSSSCLPDQLALEACSGLDCKAISKMLVLTAIAISLFITNFYFPIKEKPQR